MERVQSVTLFENEVHPKVEWELGILVLVDRSAPGQSHAQTRDTPGTIVRTMYHSTEGTEHYYRELGLGPRTRHPRTSTDVTSRLEPLQQALDFSNFQTSVYFLF